MGLETGWFFPLPQFHSYSLLVTALLESYIIQKQRQYRMLVRSLLTSLLLDVASYLHRLAFFNVTRNQQGQNLLKPNLFKTNKTAKCSFYKQNNLFIKISKFFIYVFKITSHEF